MAAGVRDVSPVVTILGRRRRRARRDRLGIGLVRTGRKVRAVLGLGVGAFISKHYA